MTLCRWMAVSMLVFGSMPVLAEDTGVPAEIEIDYELDVLPVLETNCTGCHNAAFPAAGISLASQEDVIANAELAYNAISTGRMPLGNPTFGESEGGMILSEWLAQQFEIPEPVEPTP
ncbi:hypothetical protein [Pseudobacteriovorax antillogorgiicola]|uniref:Cytochrome c domain-containing protein n=1 Tax=Pseudobacteriovorax antillogorgiicola TaxID=1513793 RepID=A0A1Y6BCW6_9BACT|nr:hypothetical protein [Pseudobacteriovorax antillogorgiicola]TCS56479.1 hypothetical protein EDD56_104301 [Pseudobacteriovorax antillogorgiicola]SMF04957.1 hypothetical protein SAMN06296036_10432 [Pseudobacteriovorax antillogorgiicola]